jgi:hypothetical protein
MSTSAYFAAMSSFQFEVEQRQYKRALTQLRKGLKLTAAALEEMHSEFAGQPSVPFFDSIGVTPDPA